MKQTTTKEQIKAALSDAISHERILAGGTVFVGTNEEGETEVRGNQSVMRDALKKLPGGKYDKAAGTWIFKPAAI